MIDIKEIKERYEKSLVDGFGLQQIEDMEILLDELEAAQNAQRWIPITERPPESGKHVLLCCEVKPSKGKYVCDGYYAAPKTIVGGCGGDFATEYDEEKDEYFLLEGYYEVIKNWDDFSSIAIEDVVTHWMLLPNPPKGDSHE